MATAKKIILFLFGIVLIVFGNKAAIDTIFKNDNGLKEVDPTEKEATATKPVITEKVVAKDTEVVSVDKPVSAPKESEVKEKTVSKKEAPKPKPTEKTTETEEPATKAVEKKEDQKVGETPTTTIEPVKEEKAKASE